MTLRTCREPQLIKSPGTLRSAQSWHRNEALQCRARPSLQRHLGNAEAWAGIAERKEKSAFRPVNNFKADKTSAGAWKPSAYKCSQIR
jgi:hypothetical protein